MAPEGMGADVRVTLTVDGRSDWTTFSYAPPVIEFFAQSRGGDASGGETLKVYGSNFGFRWTPTKIMIGDVERSEEHTSELQSLMRISYAVFCLKKKKQK